jgi:hypothetical protein
MIGMPALPDCLYTMLSIAAKQKLQNLEEKR